MEKKILCMVAAFLVFWGTEVSAQVLATGETGGKGSRALFFSANGLFPEGLELFNVYSQFVYGITDNFDGAVVYGNISALSETQHYVGFGWNANLLRRDKAFFDVSFFNVITTPLNNRSKASSVFATPSVVISRPVTISGRNLSLYTGVNASVPLGQTKDKLFTPPETFWNVPLGVSVAVSPKWVIYSEADMGSNLKTVGVGILRVF